MGVIFFLLGTQASCPRLLVESLPLLPSETSARWRLYGPFERWNAIKPEVSTYMSTVPYCPAQQRLQKLWGRDTKHNLSTKTPSPQKNTWAPPRSTGYFIKAHGWQSDYIHRLSPTPDCRSWHAVQVLIQPSVVYARLPSTISDNDNSCPRYHGDGNTATQRCHRSRRPRSADRPSVRHGEVIRQVLITSPFTTKGLEQIGAIVTVFTLEKQYLLIKLHLSKNMVNICRDVRGHILGVGARGRKRPLCRSSGSTPNDIKFNSCLKQH